jgi:hypothetical protein
MDRHAPAGSNGLRLRDHEIAYMLRVIFSSLLRRGISWDCCYISTYIPQCITYRDGELYRRGASSIPLNRVTTTLASFVDRSFTFGTVLNMEGKAPGVGRVCRFASFASVAPLPRPGLWTSHHIAFTISTERPWYGTGGGVKYPRGASDRRRAHRLWRTE